MDTEKRKVVDEPQGEAEEAYGRQEEYETPADRGKTAWIVLAAAFVLEAVIWGFPGCFGVFQDYYTKHEPFKSEPRGLAAISTTANGIMYLASPLIGLLLQHFSRYDRFFGLLGLGIMAASLLAASFVNSTAALLGTQGVLYAIGGLMAYFPAIYVVDGWFIARKGFAFGVVLTGTGVGGAVLPFLFQWLLDNYGFRITLRIWAVIMVVFILPSVLAMRRRPGSTRTAKHKSLRDLSFILQPPFWIFQLGNICMSLSFFLPSIYLPSFATSIDLPAFSGPLALCLANVGACFGYLLHGYLIDHMDLIIVITLSSIVTALSFLVFWGLATSQGMLYTFALVWGLSGGGYAATWSGCARSIVSRCKSIDHGSDVAGDGEVHEQTADTGFVMSLMCAGKGIGSILSGPISEQLLRSKTLGAGSTYGGIYGDLIIFAGVMALLGGLPALGRVLKLL